MSLMMSQVSAGLLVLRHHVHESDSIEDWNEGMSERSR